MFIIGFCCMEALFNNWGGGIVPIPYSLFEKYIYGTKNICYEKGIRL